MVRDHEHLGVEPLPAKRGQDPAELRVGLPERLVGHARADPRGVLRGVGLGKPDHRHVGVDLAGRT